MEEISGVAFIFNQKFFQDLRQETGKREKTHATTKHSQPTSHFLTLLQRLEQIRLDTVPAVVELHEREHRRVLSVVIN